MCPLISRPCKISRGQGRDFVEKVIKNINYAISRVSAQTKVKLYIKIPIPTPEEDYGLTDKDAKKAIRRFANIESPNVGIKLMPLALQNDGVILKRRSCNMPCEQVFYMAYIKFDGRVSVCCVDIYDNLSVGRIPEQSFSEIVGGEALRQIRKIHLEGRLQEIPLCFYCGSRTAVDLSPYREEIRRYI